MADTPSEPCSCFTNRTTPPMSDELEGGSSTTPTGLDLILWKRMNELEERQKSDQARIQLLEETVIEMEMEAQVTKEKLEKVEIKLKDFKGRDAATQQSDGSTNDSQSPQYPAESSGPRDTWIAQRPNALDNSINILSNQATVEDGGLDGLREQVSDVDVAPKRINTGRGPGESKKDPTGMEGNLEDLSRRIKELEETTRKRDEDNKAHKRLEILNASREYIVRRLGCESWIKYSKIEYGKDAGTWNFQDAYHRAAAKFEWYMAYGWNMVNDIDDENVYEFLNAVFFNDKRIDVMEAQKRQYWDAAEGDEELMKMVRVLEKNGFWDPKTEAFSTKVVKEPDFSLDYDYYRGVRGAGPYQDYDTRMNKEGKARPGDSGMAFISKRNGKTVRSRGYKYDDSYNGYGGGGTSYGGSAYSKIFTYNC
ncbi:hypothetical protein BJ508DRAFT_378631 [Ascobolus immersus RN42]|uniref:Uncharacterized protein n=1 Tax=Ascobolus immersus RN42 TaxID=1160509 RepID=A0A3N4HZA4_ASCIM|nr:hypothetical protein BJ508DRAFT_378631 [Ascobolus immersus RN42]